MEYLHPNWNRHLHSCPSPCVDALPPSPTRWWAGSSLLTDGHLENPGNHAYPWIQNKSKKRNRLASYDGAQDRVTTSNCPRPAVTIDMLPDIFLLELFNLYVNQVGPIEQWHTLVHVCRRWRDVVFESPRRLGLRLLCTARKPVREVLSVWPRLPIVIRHGRRPTDSIVAALEHTDRVCEIRLWPVPSSQWEHVLQTMNQPFHELTDLQLQSEDESATVIPDSFLDGTAPRLQSLRFERIPFPKLPNLLSSARDLVKISLQKIPHSGYISPEAMVNCLSTLTRLTELDISFISPLSCPNRYGRHPPPPTRTVLQSLRHFGYGGVSECLEDYVARIDTPSLCSLQTKFFHQLIFYTPELTRFISRTPGLETNKEAHIDIFNSGVSVLLPGAIGRGLRLEISCRQSDWQLSSLTQVCNSSFPWALTSSLEHLYIGGKCSRLIWLGDIENSQWLELLRPFIAVKRLHLSHELATRIVPVLQELGRERMTEELPALQCLYLEEDTRWGRIREAKAIIDV